MAAGEMYVFFSLLMVMGIVKLPQINMYWTRKFIMSGPKVFCKEVMSRNRFFSILKFLRFSHCVEHVRPDSSKSRIEPFLDKLREKCSRLLHPGLHLAIDESLMLFKGRLGFKQFIRTKRSRFGIKLFGMCPSIIEFAGYTWNFDVYYGRESNFNSKLTEEDQGGQPTPPGSPAPAPPPVPVDVPGPSTNRGATRPRASGTRQSHRGTR